MLQVCADVDDYTRFCTVLTGFAESDYRSDAVQHGSTFGVFQQTDAVNNAGVPFWPSAHGSTADQCRAFLADFWVNRIRHNGDPVHDCWVTQRWSVPNEGATWPDPGPGFTTAPETLNYSRRLAAIPHIIATGVLT